MKDSYSDYEKQVSRTEAFADDLKKAQVEIDNYKRTVKEEYAKREALEAEIDRLTHRLFQMNKALESMTTKYSDLLISTRGSDEKNKR